MALLQAVIKELRDEVFRQLAATADRGSRNGRSGRVCGRPGPWSGRPRRGTLPDAGLQKRTPQGWRFFGIDDARGELESDLAAFLQSQAGAGRRSFKHCQLASRSRNADRGRPRCDAGCRNNGAETERIGTRAGSGYRRQLAARRLTETRLPVNEFDQHLHAIVDNSLRVSTLHLFRSLSAGVGTRRPIPAIRVHPL